MSGALAEAEALNYAHDRTMPTDLSVALSLRNEKTSNTSSLELHTH